MIVRKKGKEDRKVMMMMMMITRTDQFRMMKNFINNTYIIIYSYVILLMSLIMILSFREIQTVPSLSSLQTEPHSTAAVVSLNIGIYYPQALSFQPSLDVLNVMNFSQGWNHFGCFGNFCFGLPG